MKVLLWILGLGAVVYVAVCLLLYFQQERLLFFPTKLSAQHRFLFPGRFEERWVTTPDGTQLHALHFRTETPTPKGLVFYLHGNGGALDDWGMVAPTYTRLGYDVFLLDYRGYGKSGGHISSQEQFLEDVEVAYRHVLKEYPEDRTVVLGYSLGTGAAAWLAARYRPKLLILQAPYLSMRAVARQHYPWIPSAILRYLLNTEEVMPQISAPILIFHGERDELISHAASLKLKSLLKPQDQFITLRGAGHNGLTDNAEYQAVLQSVL
ncbi:alpha/beta fold hydrolase [Hymenobacter seoulensis]